jgi:PhnB protein
MKLGATLYIKNSLEAVPFYASAFGLTLGFHVKYPDGTYMHAVLARDGEEVFAVSESRNDAFVDMMLNSDWEKARPTMSYGLSFSSENEVRKAYAMLCEGGTVLTPIGPLPWTASSANVVDRFGVLWYIEARPAAEGG